MSLEAVGRRCPVALPWMESCYRARSSLYCGDRVLQSESGEQGTRVGRRGSLGDDL